VAARKHPISIHLLQGMPERGEHCHAPFIGEGQETDQQFNSGTVMSSPGLGLRLANVAPLRLQQPHCNMWQHVATNS